MKFGIWLSLVLALFCLVDWSASNSRLEAAPFEGIAVKFEQNATDGDAEVVFEVDSGREGLRELRVIAPDKRIVVDFKSPDLKLGVRQFQVESPEPNDVKSIQADYPQGAYSFQGTSVSGEQLSGTARLSHLLPPTANIVFPPPDAEDVAYEALVVKWKVHGDLRACIVVIEQEEQDLEVSARIPANTTSFAVPNGFLSPSSEYKLAIGTVGKTGNLSFVETEFTTRAARR